MHLFRKSDVRGRRFYHIDLICWSLIPVLPENSLQNSIENKMGSLKNELKDEWRTLKFKISLPVEKCIIFSFLQENKKNHFVFLFYFVMNFMEVAVISKIRKR